MLEGLPEEWRAFLGDRLAALDLAPLKRALVETTVGEAYPPRDLVFEALRRTPPDKVRVVILGQDPYPTKGQACGLAFSVRAQLPPGVRRPTSLGNILAELRREGFTAPVGATLDRWPDVGILLLNTALTVRADVPGSHIELWTPFTRGVIDALVHRPKPIVFLLWGTHAQEWLSSIRPPHEALLSPHPAARGRGPRFRNDPPFRRAADIVEGLGLPPMDWRAAK